MSLLANAGNLGGIDIILFLGLTVDSLLMPFVSLYRPLSKTVRFNVLKVVPAGSSGLGKKAFTGM